MKNRKHRIQRDFVFLTCSMFIVVSIWIALNVYETLVTSTIDQRLQTQILPIKGTFDKQSIETIRNRIPVVPDYTASEAASIPTPLPSTPPVSASFSGELVAPNPTGVLSP